MLESRPRLALALCLTALVAACEHSQAPGPHARDERAVPSPTQTGDTELEPTAALEDEAIPITLPAGAQARGQRSARASTPSGASSAAGPAVGESLSDCFSRCEGAGLSEDNRATCRLLCKTHHERADPSDSSAVIGSYFGCFDQCEGQARCQRDCASNSRSSACARRCLGGLGRCVGPCEGRDNEGRCSESCETAANRCIGDC